MLHNQLFYNKGDYPEFKPRKWKCHVNSFKALKHNVVPGIDGMMWHGYSKDLEENLLSLHTHVDTWKYRAIPVKRECIPKRDGMKRPI
mgnify:CR=1 FL=1